MLHYVVHGALQSSKQRKSFTFIHSASAFIHSDLQMRSITRSLPSEPTMFVEISSVS